MCLDCLANNIACITIHAGSKGAGGNDSLAGTVHVLLHTQYKAVVPH